MTDPHQPQKEYIIDERQINALRLELPPAIIDDLMSRPAPASTTAPDSFVESRSKDPEFIRNGRCGVFKAWLPKHDAAVARQAREQEIHTTLDVVRNTLERYEDNEAGTLEDALGDIRNHLEGSLIDAQEKAESLRSQQQAGEQG